MKDNGRAGQNEQRDAFMDSRPIKASPNYTLDTNPIKLDAAQLCALPFLLADFPSSISLPLRPPHGAKPPLCRPPPRARVASSCPRRPPGSPAFSGALVSRAHQALRVPSCSISTASPPRHPLGIMPGTSPPALPPNRLVSSLTTNPSTVSSCCCDSDALLAGLPGAAFRRTGVERAEPRANLVVSTREGMFSLAWVSC